MLRSNRAAREKVIPLDRSGRKSRPAPLRFDAVAYLNLLLKRGESIRGRSFVGMDLRDVRFPPGTDLTGANFNRCLLDGAVFDDCIVNSAKFTAADLYEASFKRASCVGANFERACAQGIDFTDADLTDARFDGAEICHAVMQGTKLDHASLWRAWATGVVLTGAVVRHTLIALADFS